MPRFEPFRGVRFDAATLDLAEVTAPPYDVIDDAERARLAALSPYNVVWVDLPLEEEGVDRYEVACRLYRRWQEQGVLVGDAEPSLYLYRMGYHDDAGRSRSTMGVIGALELEAPGVGDVLPHEQTTPKAKSDRLAMLRACDANLSPIWGLSLASGLSTLCEPEGEPLVDCIDEHGVQHCLWRVTDADRQAALARSVASAPVVIADGHHRYETALAYRDERRTATGAPSGPWDLVMMYVVELAESQLTVGPIHRLLAGFPDDFDFEAALAELFEVLPGGDADPSVARRMDEAGALGMVLPGGRAMLLRPRPERFAAVRDIDAERFDLARSSLPPHEVTYQHGIENVMRLVDKGEAQVGILLRPVAVSEIAAVAHARDRMPPKSTYFFPKPRTGMVFRSLSE